MKLVSHPGGTRAFWDVRLPDRAVGLAWLDQAGLALRHTHHRLLIDPSLSDHLARKYAGTEFPHTRMMPAPLETILTSCFAPIGTATIWTPAHWRRSQAT